MARGLGKGFESILPADIDVSKLLGGVEIKNLSIDVVKPNPKQPRRTISQDALQELADSMIAHGVLQPIIVVRNEGDYVIVAGERRWRAAQLAGLKQIPSIVRTLDDLAQLQVALIENVQRVELNPIEAAESIRRLNQDFGHTFAQIAKSLGKSKPAVVNIYRLLRLPNDVTQALTDGLITEGHARCFLGLLDHEDARAELLKQIINNQWSVRRSERYVQAIKENGGLFKKEMVKRDIIEKTWTKNLSKKINAKVEVKPRVGKGGYVKIVYTDPEHLKSIIKSLE